MRAATLFSGIGAPEVAMPRWDWLWHAEIEKFPSAVFAARHPQSQNLGDVGGKKFVAKAREAGRPDVLIFGSPCQDFSVAGHRLGLDGARGNMALEALAVARQLGTEWLVFENVPGMFSSYSGSAEAEREIRGCADRALRYGQSVDAQEDSDFAAFLSAVRECGYYGCWRVLNAEYFGLAQRRRRLFFVARLRDWRGPAAVLFEPDSLRGDSPPRRETGQGVAPTISARPSAGGGLGTDFDLDGGLIASTGDIAHCLNAGAMGRIDYETETMVAHALRADGFDASEDGTGRGTPLVAVPFDTTQITSKTNRCQPQDGDPCHPITAEGHPPAIAFTCKDYGADMQIEHAPTLRAMGHTDSHANAGGQLAVAFQSRIARNGRGQPEDVVPALNGADAGATSDMRPLIAAQESHDADAEEAHTTEVLRSLRREVGEEAFAKWGLRVVASLQSEEVLRAGVHGSGLRREAGQGERNVGDGSPSRAESEGTGGVRGLWEAGPGRSSRGRELPQQLTRKLSEALSKLPSEAAQARTLLLALRRSGEGIGALQQALHSVSQQRLRWVVRRLTPMECERLQGFPDNFTLVNYRGKPAQDGPRYKALGNSMAVPVMRHILTRLESVDTHLRLVAQSAG